jgi:hypothetical protein
VCVTISAEYVIIAAGCVTIAAVCVTIIAECGATAAECVTITAECVTIAAEYVIGIPYSYCLCIYVLVNSSVMFSIWCPPSRYVIFLILHTNALYIHQTTYDNAD